MLTKIDVQTQLDLGCLWIDYENKIISIIGYKYISFFNNWLLIKLILCLDVLIEKWF